MESWPWSRVPSQLAGLPPLAAPPRDPTHTDMSVGQALQQAGLLVAGGGTDAGSQLAQVTLGDL